MNALFVVLRANIVVNPDFPVAGSCVVDSVVVATSTDSNAVCGTAVFVNLPFVVDVSGAVIGTIVDLDAVDSAAVGSVVVAACVVNKVVVANSFWGIVIVVGDIVDIVGGLSSTVIKASVVMNGNREFVNAVDSASGVVVDSISSVAVDVSPVVLGANVDVNFDDSAIIDNAVVVWVVVEPCVVDTVV